MSKFFLDVCCCGPSLFLRCRPYDKKKTSGCSVFFFSHSYVFLWTGLLLFCFNGLSLSGDRSVSRRRTQWNIRLDRGRVQSLENLLGSMRNKPGNIGDMSILCTHTQKFNRGSSN